MFLTTILVAVLAFILGGFCGFWFAIGGLTIKLRTHDFIKGEWVERKFNVAEMMFGKDGS